MIQKMEKMYQILSVNDSSSHKNTSNLFVCRFFKDTFLDVEESELRYTYFLMLLRYIPELNILVASTNIKQCLGWRYNST
jgi:hypothetical protein